MYTTGRSQTSQSTRMIGVATMALVVAGVGGAWVNAKFKAQDMEIVQTSELVFIDNPRMTPPPEVVVPENTEAQIDVPTDAIDVVLPDFVYEAPADAAPIAVAATTTTAAPAPAATGTPGETKSAKLIRRNLPTYPSQSIRAQEAGQMSMEICVNEKGAVQSATVTRSTSFPRLDEAALSWIRQQRFSPAMTQGRAQAVCGVAVDYVWDLKNAR